jgi:hypothetical protein
VLYPPIQISVETMLVASVVIALALGGSPWANTDAVAKAKDAVGRMTLVEKLGYIAGNNRCVGSVRFGLLSPVFDQISHRSSTLALHVGLLIRDWRSSLACGWHETDSGCHSTLAPSDALLALKNIQRLQQQRQHVCWKHLRGGTARTSSAPPGRRSARSWR